MRTAAVSRSRREFASALRNYARTGQTKESTLGGDGKDDDFESAFSSIAHAFMRDRAPSLQQYEIGFQLIDRNQENTKACGVTGYKVGQLWLYAPVLYLNGDLKGHELLYDKNEDQFVPLKENWLNVYLQKQPHILGEPVDRSPWKHGITAPNLQSFSRSPGKMASAISRDMLPGVAAFSYFATQNPYTDPKYANPLDLPSFLKKEGKAVIVKLCQTMLHFPKLASAFERTYGDLKVIREALAACCDEDDRGVLGKQSAESCSAGSSMSVKSQRRSVKQAPSGSVLTEPAKADLFKSGALAVYTLRTPDSCLNSLSVQDRGKLLQDEVLFLDKRSAEESSVAYTVREPLMLTNPTDTDIYDILVKPGSFERCLVIVGPYSADRRKEFATVVRLDGEKSFINIHPSALWVKQKAETNREDYNSYLRSLPEANSLEESDDYHVLVGPGGQATCPFRVNEPVSVNGDSKTYSVYFKDHARIERPGNLPTLARRHSGYESDDNYGFGRYGERITFTNKKGGSLVVMAGDLFVPDGFKLLLAKKGPPENERGLFCSPSDYSDPPPIIPGNKLDLRQAIFDKTAGLKIAHLGSEVQINGQSMSPLAGLVHLVAHHGLREESARHVIKEAEQKQVCRYRIKYAQGYGYGSDYPQGYPLQQSAPNAPGHPDFPQWQEPTLSGGVNATGPQYSQVPVGMPYPDPSVYDPRIMPDQHSVQTAMEASQSGQKEVFDASVIGSLVKAMRDDTMVDRHMPDLMSALDKLGRILFSFYWHGEAFQERYGKQDMPNIEDGLRNTFESLGDVILGLKKKMVEPFADEMSRIDMGDVARD